jgi:CheY-like chemotaxis protein
MTDQNDTTEDVSTRLLIVDDSPTTLRVLKAIFERERYDVLTASDGMEAYAKANQFRPDLVITDNVMPMMGGIALLKKLRENPITRELPVIILTAEDPAYARPPEELKPDAFIMKSDDCAPLLAEVERVLASATSGRRRKSQHLQTRDRNADS